jgi:hypothetical protein
MKTRRAFAAHRGAVPAAQFRQNFFSPLKEENLVPKQPL